MRFDKAFDFIAWLWQFPQNFIGWLLMAWVEPEAPIFDYCLAVVVPNKKIGDFCLGRYIFIKADVKDEPSGGKTYHVEEELLKHEYGHTLQSLTLGWLYLILIALPSVIRYSRCNRTGDWNNYYHAYPEDWADKLGGVERTPE